MQLKNLFGFILIVGALTACDTGSSKIALNQQELQRATIDGKVNGNVVAQSLIKKSILNEIKNAPFTQEEKNLLAEAKENLEIEAFLNKQASAAVNVADEEVNKAYEEFYKQNEEQLKAIENLDVDRLKLQIRQNIFGQKLANEKVRIVNDLITKYNLNDILKQYVPQASQVPATVPGANNQQPTTTTPVPSSTTDKPTTEAAPAATPEKTPETTPTTPATKEEPKK